MHPKSFVDDFYRFSSGTGTFAHCVKYLLIDWRGAVDDLRQERSIKQCLDVVITCEKGHGLMMYRMSGEY
jgi:hypothetical protein